MLQQQARELEELRCARDADTESDESETVAPAASSGGVEHAGGMKVFRAEHRKKVTTEMMRLDKEAEEEAAELGLLMPRTLQALKTLRATAEQEGSVVVPPLSAGMVLRCKAEVCVKAAEYKVCVKAEVCVKAAECWCCCCCSSCHAFTLCCHADTLLVLLVLLLLSCCHSHIGGHSHQEQEHGQRSAGGSS